MMEFIVAILGFQAAQVGLLAGIFFRLGSHSERIKTVEQHFLRRAA